MDALQMEIIGGTVAVMASIGLLAWWARRMHHLTQEKVDGVRTRLEQHADQTELALKNDVKGLMTLRASVFKHVKEFFELLFPSPPP